MKATLVAVSRYGVVRPLKQTVSRLIYPKASDTLVISYANRGDWSPGVHGTAMTIFTDRGDRRKEIPVILLVYLFQTFLYDHSTNQIATFYIYKSPVHTYVHVRTEAAVVNAEKALVTNVRDHQKN